jgi:hypothetical protein
MHGPIEIERINTDLARLWTVSRPCRMTIALAGTGA